HGCRCDRSAAASSCTSAGHDMTGSLGVAIPTYCHRDYIGLMTDDDGKLTIDRDILAGALSPDRADDTFNTLTALKDAIGDKANSVTVNPMNYVQKVVVAYKNPGHNFNTPYISSIYSGMMLDSYA
ncbi:MAG: hypothetical protein ACEQR7_11170, partial [Agathobacter rectalis]